VIIKHEAVGDIDSHYSLYSHLERYTIEVAVGDTVFAGQYLANMGNTGWSHGTHLHFEIRTGGPFDCYRSKYSELIP